MSDIVRLYCDDDIRIEWDYQRKYVLNTPETKLFCYHQIVTNDAGETVLSFEPKNERFWDAKLLLGRKPMIGRAICGGDTFDVRVQGVKTQKVFLGQVHTVSRLGDTLMRGEEFNRENRNHLALLLFLAEKMDRRG